MTRTFQPRTPARGEARRALLFAVVAAGLLPAGRAAAGDDAPPKGHLALEDIAQGFRAIERWHVDDARRIAERAYREHPDYPLTLALVGEVKMHMSDYQGALEFYRRARDAGAPEQILQTESLARATRQATEGYEEYVGEHFIVRYPAGKDAILVPYTLETLEKARERLGELLGWRPDSRVVVEIYPSADTLAHVSTLTEKEIRDSGTIALCRWNRLMVTSPRAVYFGYAWRDTMAHELTHLIIGGASSNTVPIWLHEGIAKFSETAWRGEPGDGLSVDQQVAVRDAARKGKLIPFEKMHPSMAKLKSQEETSLAFAEVFTFIEFLVKRKGWDGMREVLRLMAGGASDEEAIRTVHGKSLKALSEDWMAGLKTREVRQSNAIAADRKVVVKAQPDAPDDQFHGLSKKGRRFARAADLLYARGRLKAAQKELEKAYKETGSPVLSAKLAHVALATGDLESAENAARQAIAGSPDLAGPNITLAEILVRRGKTAEARAPLDRALSVNPFDPRIYQLLIAVSGDAPAKKREAELAQMLLGAEHGPSERSLGRGGLVQIESLPFARVFIARADGSCVEHAGAVEGGGDPATKTLERSTGSTAAAARESCSHAFIPTGMVTPTAPVTLKPGHVEVRLVPPAGQPVSRTVTVVEAQEGGTPQLITPDSTGS